MIIYFEIFIFVFILSYPFILILLSSLFYFHINYRSTIHSSKKYSNPFFSILILSYRYNHKLQVITNNDIQQPVQLLDSVATALTRAGMHDRAGDFYERLEELQRALDSYIRGSAYRKAVELARRSFPSRVVELQEQWGDYLVSIKC